MDKETPRQYNQLCQLKIYGETDDVSVDRCVTNNVRDMSISYDNRTFDCSLDKDAGVQNERERNMSPGKPKIGPSIEENHQSGLGEKDEKNAGFSVCRGETPASRHDEDEVVSGSEILTHEKEYKQLVAKNLQLRSELRNLRKVIRIQEHAISWYLQYPEVQSIAAALFSCDTEKDI